MAQYQVENKDDYPGSAGEINANTDCANLCQGKAISFQSIDEIRKLSAKEKIWSKVKAVLKE